MWKLPSMVNTNMKITDLMRHTRIDEISRRGFLKGTGVAAAGVAVPGLAKGASGGMFSPEESPAVVFFLHGFLSKKWNNWPEARDVQSQKVLAMYNQLVGDVAKEYAPGTEQYFYTVRDDVVALFKGEIESDEYQQRIEKHQSELTQAIHSQINTEQLKRNPNKANLFMVARKKGNEIWDKALASYQ
jgi:hypothetical protein